MVTPNVKNTIVERVLEIVAPHPCNSCGKVGKILCASCKYDIIHERFGGCILCAKPQKDGICTHHDAPFTQSFVIGERSEALEQLINALKFQRTRAAASVLADLLHQSLPLFPENIVLVPVPTSAKHVRQRGYDQVKLITRYFSAKRNYRIEDILVRTKNTTQHLVGRADRATQAQGLYTLKDTAQVTPGALYLIIDDIITTGATVSAAAGCLKAAGGQVWVAALAYQPNNA